jgi:large-conductance mechanosensitive channel
MTITRVALPAKLNPDPKEPTTNELLTEIRELLKELRDK